MGEVGGLRPGERREAMGELTIGIECRDRCQ